MSPSRRAVLAGSGVGLTALLAGVFGRDRWEPGSSPYDWPMARYDAAGTAHNPDASGPKAEPTVRWEADGRIFLGTESAGPLAPIRLGSVLYTAGKRLRAIETDTGTVRFQHDGEYNTPPVRARADQYETDTIALGTQQGLVGCNAGGGLRLFGESYGTRRWLSDGFGPAEDEVSGFFGPREVASQPLGRNGTIYSLTPSEPWAEVVAIDPGDGSVRWRFQPEVPERSFFDPLSRPALRDGSLYLVTSAGSVVSIAADGSTQQWHRSLDRQDLASPTATAAGLLVPHENGLRLLGSDGSTRWDRTLSDQPKTATPVAATDEIAAVVHGETLYAFDLERGTTLWTAEGFDRAPVIAGGVVYVTSVSRLAGFDLATGERFFEFEHSEHLRGPLSPPVVGDGRLYCNAHTKTIALEEP